LIILLRLQRLADRRAHRLLARQQGQRLARFGKEYLAKAAETMIEHAWQHAWLLDTQSHPAVFGFNGTG
jgi:hypothetical protein